jgi:hypothetical protein
MESRGSQGPFRCRTEVFPSEFVANEQFHMLIGMVVISVCITDGLVIERFDLIESPYRTARCVKRIFISLNIAIEYFVYSFLNLSILNKKTIKRETKYGFLFNYN